MSLRFRSTGLGKTMLEGEPADVMVVVLWLHQREETEIIRGFLKDSRLLFKEPILQ